MPKRMQSGLRRAINAMPGKTFAQRKLSLATGIGITVQSINKWTRAPRRRIVDIERVSGVDRKHLAPELYR